MKGLESILMMSSQIISKKVLANSQSTKKTPYLYVQLILQYKRNKVKDSK